MSAAVSGRLTIETAVSQACSVSGPPVRSVHALSETKSLHGQFFQDIFSGLAQYCFLALFIPHLLSLPN